MLTVTGHGSSSLMISACVIVAQGGMLPAALVVGRVADRLGHRPLLLTAFAILPIQALLMTLGDSLPWLLSLQFLGGLGIGVLVALTPLLLADATAGTGRYNLAQGAIATMSSIGAVSSGLAAEFIIGQFGYRPAFVFCGGVAAIALLLVWLGMPETSHPPA
jgi:MFS family permease